MNANILATFERKAPPLDHFIGESSEWSEVTKAWVSVEPAALMAQRFEFEDTQGIASQSRYTLATMWTPTLAGIDTACRVRATTPDGIERTYQIQSLVNVGNANRELQYTCIEAT